MAAGLGPLVNESEGGKESDKQASRHLVGSDDSVGGEREEWDKEEPWRD